MISIPGTGPLPFSRWRAGFRVGMSAAAVLAFWLASASGSATAADNFLCEDTEMVQAAEQSRCRSALFWTGQHLPGNWSSPCPITVVRANHSGGGRTTFRFDQGEVSGWRMEVTGTRKGILENVIPHEVDHMVRASLVRHPLERWLDEGCALLLESPEMHAFLRCKAAEVDPSIISASWLMRRDYPQDPRELDSLYAVGFSLVEYLLTRGTPRRLLEFQREPGPVPLRLQRHYRMTPEQLRAGWSGWRAQRQHADCACGGCPLHQPIEGIAAEEAISVGQVPLIVWTAEWCGPCRQFKQDYASLPAFRTAIDSRYSLQWRDIDQHPSLPDSPVSGVPMWVLPDRQWTGYGGPEDLLRRLGITEDFSGKDLPPATKHAPSADSEDTVEIESVPAESGEVVSLPAGNQSPSVTAIPASGAEGWRILRWIPVTLSAMQWLGVIGGSVATGGLVGIALTAATVVFRGGRRLHRWRKGPGSHNVEPGERSGAGLVAPFPRQLDEAGELLGLRQSEGRVATLDALRGMFLDDELDKLEQTEGHAAQLATSLRKAIDLRVAEVAPLTTDIS